MVSIIVAMTKDRVIGKDNKLIWHLPEDMESFKKLTTGNVVIMGRKTRDSLPSKFRPLPNRHNVVVSSSLSNASGAEVYSDIQEAIEESKRYGKEIFIIGGSTVYRQTVPFADKMYVSWVKKFYEGDAYFPDFDLNEWIAESKKEFADFDLVVYVRKNNK